MIRRRTASPQNIRVWRKPLILVATTLVALLLALFEEGVADVVSAGLLALPVVVCMRSVLRAARSK